MCNGSTNIPKPPSCRGDHLPALRTGSPRRESTSSSELGVAQVTPPSGFVVKVTGVPAATEHNSDGPGRLG